MDEPIRVTVWNEFRHERDAAHPASRIYPDGIHTAIAGYLASLPGLSVGAATLDEPDHGLGADVLAATDVLVWWGHIAHGEVRDDVAREIQRRVLSGMGFIALHASIHSKPLRLLLGTTCDVKWRDVGERERIWVIEPGHPIAAGLPETFVIPQEEMYGERFDIPAPDALVMLSWFPGGEVFRSGCCFHRGAGKIFYFRPGHETHPTYWQPEVQLVIANAVRWAAPPRQAPVCIYGNRQPLEPLRTP